MKKTLSLFNGAILLRFLLCIGFFVSIIQACKSPDNVKAVDQPINSSVNLKLIEELEQSPNSVVWVSYPDLNPEEKAVLWHRHLGKMLLNKSYNRSQIDHIKELDKIINADLYKNLNDPETKKFLEDFHQEWFVKSVESNLFSVEQLLAISSLASIGNSSAHGRVQAPLKACDCRYGISCSDARCPDNKSCTTPSFDNRTNCGIAGTSVCTGKCV
ncbi:bacteriocin fulvocin C-related protein [Larkinella sp. VNQ87]|uniref:bacteriocin fulvocin C-related protein n=1 Tax=Larkinella sp. VNQ87 TaxID=3400921 RepID=UPI003C02193C